MSAQKLTHYDEKFGITGAHWHVFLRFATQRKKVVMVRATKPAAIPWIERKFPAKPLEFKTKTDPFLGLLIARTPAELENVKHTGNFVEPMPNNMDVRRFVEELVVKRNNPTAKSPASRPGTTPKAEAYLVIERNSGLPFTSDYDLSAVFDLDHPDYFLTFGSQATTVGGNRTNLYTNAAIRELNRRFGSERIMHGTQAQGTGDAANGDYEHILVFAPQGIYPQGQAEVIKTAEAYRSWEVLRDILTRYNPDMAYSFRN